MEKTLSESLKLQILLRMFGNKIKSLFKKLTPPTLWNVVRKYSNRRYRYMIADFFRCFGAYFCVINYCGYKLYYSRGDDSVGRIIKKGDICEKSLCVAIGKDFSNIFERERESTCGYWSEYRVDCSGCFNS